MAMVMVFTMVACGDTANDADNDTTGNVTTNANDSEEDNTSDDEEDSKTVSTDGSTSMESVIGYLSEAYMESHDGVTITYNPTGSSAGIQAVSEGRCDIGLSSRDLKDDEAETLNGTVVAIDGIAIIVNTENPVSDLTVEQIAALYTGEITNWSEVGGADEEIAFIGREAGSGTRGAFEELTGTEDACSYAQELTSTGAVRTAVSTTPGAIGYISLSSLDDSVKAIAVKVDDASEAVKCTEETVLDGSYAIQRPFVFATKSDAELSEAAQAFYDFATSEDAAQIYIDAGVVPASESAE